MKEFAQEYDHFRKVVATRIELMVPRGLPPSSPLFPLLQRAIEQVIAYEFAADDMSDRSRGVVVVDGHEFRWCVHRTPTLYPGPGTINTSPVEGELVLTVYLPH